MRREGETMEGGGLEREADGCLGMGHHGAGWLLVGCLAGGCVAFVVGGRLWES